MPRDLKFSIQTRDGPMVYDPSKPWRLDFGVPAGSQAEIVQNLVVLYTTPKFSQMLDRDLGLDLTLVDKPYPVAMNMIISEIIEATGEFEPRVKIDDVIFPPISDPITGNLVAAITVRFLTN
jgi:phage baseplate assembly protein W